MLDCLHFYSSFGWPLFPCHASGPKAKAPLTSHGFKDATTDLGQIEEWHKAYPNCAWGVATSAERGVIDIDPKHGGDKTLAALIAEHGALPDTPRVRTGSNGFHYWFRFPAGTPCGKPFAGVDRKAEGGYVIVPPSRIDIPEHDGRSYCWEVKEWEGFPIAEAPAWLLNVKPTPKVKAEAENPWVVKASSLDLLTHQGSPEGERRKTLCQLVGVHLSRGDSEASVLAMAEAWAMRCQPPLDGQPDPLDHWRQHTERFIRREQAKADARAGKMTSSLSPTPIQAVSLPLGLGKEGINSSAQAPASGSELIPSFPAFPPSAEADAQADWPTLPPEAYHGLLGDMLRAVEPETEADPAGVLLGWLCCFGSIVGRGAWMTIGARLHHPALYVGIVGRTSDAKGDTWAVSLYPFKQIEPAWASACIANGVGSGEGLVERVADAQIVIDKDGAAKAIPGALDKRCLLRLSELSRCFKIGRRENATLSEYLREGWDGEPITIPNRKGNALSTSDYAISMVGDITPGVLRKLLESGTEAFDGAANRYLWACVKRSRFLPSGGNIGVLQPYLEHLKSALAFAKGAGEVKRDAEADALWDKVYPSLTTSGDDVAHTDRARPYALRLAMLYALADGSKVIRLEHLKAALALWSYCRESAKKIFGSQQQAEADPLWLQVLNAISKSPGVSRSDLLRAFRSVDADTMGGVLQGLEAQSMAYKQTVLAEGGGRPAECWYPGPKPDGSEPDAKAEGEAESVAADIIPPPSRHNQADAPAETSGRKELTPADAYGGSVGKERKEGINSADALPEPGVISFLPKPEGINSEPKAEGSYFLPSQADDEKGSARGDVNQEPEIELEWSPEDIAFLKELEQVNMESKPDYFNADGTVRVVAPA